MLLPRLITAIVGIPLILTAVYWGGIPFFVMLLGIVFLSLREYFVLVQQGKYSSQPVIGTISGLLLFFSIFLNGTKICALAENQGTSAFITLMLAVLFLREMIRSSVQMAIERLSITFFGAFFISWALGHLILIRNLRPNGMWYIYFLFIIIWAIDTGAYIAGKKLGKYRLAEVVSPKKTIEGAVGGILIGMFGAMLFRLIFLKEFITIGESALLGFFIAIVSQFSDLAESILKRDVGVKDSANLLPGHGGMLDRFDSFLFTAPLLYYYLAIFK